MEFNSKDNVWEKNQPKISEKLIVDFYSYENLIKSKWIPKNEKYSLSRSKIWLALSKKDLSSHSCSDYSIFSSFDYLKQKSIKFSHNQLNKLLAQKISTDLSSWRKLNEFMASYLNKLNLSKHHKILSKIKPGITCEMKSKLFKILLMTKDTINNNFLSSNLVTILNYSDFEFIDKDMRGIKISGADLSGSLIINSEFDGCSFCGVNLIQSNIYNSSFKNCNMETVEFGQIIFSANKINISKLFYSPDGRFIATLYTDSILTFWDIETQQKSKFIQLSSVSYLAFSKTWKIIGTVDNQHIITLWNLELMTTINSFLHGDLINSIEFSSSEKYLISCGCDSKIKMWDISAIEPIKVFTAHRSSVLVAKFILSDTYIISCGYDRWIIKWEVNSTKIVSTLEDDQEIVSIHILNNERYLASVKYEGISLWDIISDEKIMNFGIFDYFIPIVFSGCGKYMAYCDKNYNIRIWSLMKWKETKVFRRLGHNIDTLCFSPCRKYLTSAGSNDKIKIFILNRLMKSKNAQWYTNSISMALISPDNKYAATLCKNKEFALWNIEENKLEGIVPVKNITAMAFSPCGQFLAATMRWKICIWELKTLTQVKEITGIFDSISHIFYSGKGNSIIFMIKNAIKIIDINNPNIWKRFAESSYCKAPIVISPLYKYIAACHSFKNQIVIWKAESGSKMKLLHGDNSKLLSLSFSLSEEYIATVNQDRQIVIWKVSSGEISKKIQTDNASSLLFTKSNNFLLWNSFDGTLTILIHESLKKYKKNIFGLNLVDVSKSQNIFITAGLDNSVKIWKLI